MPEVKMQPPQAAPPAPVAEPKPAPQPDATPKAKPAKQQQPLTTKNHYECDFALLLDVVLYENVRQGLWIKICNFL